MGRESVFRLRIEQGNKLPFDNINPEDWRCGRIPLGLNKASAFGLLTIPVHVAGGQFGQAKFAVLYVRASLGQCH